VNMIDGRELVIANTLWEDVKGNHQLRGAHIPSVLNMSYHEIHLLLMRQILLESLTQGHITVLTWSQWLPVT
jgi:hypothetical protein